MLLFTILVWLSMTTARTGKSSTSRSVRYAHERGQWCLTPWIKQPPGIRGTGYVVDALEAALWAFWNSGSYAEGALKAIKLGDDADTTGAIHGQLADAYYGVKVIPREWCYKIALQGGYTGLRGETVSAAQRAR